MLTPVDELSLLLRPAGGGVFLLSTGRQEQLAMQRRLYAADLSLASEASDVLAEEGIREAFLARLRRIGEAKLIVLGAPSDVGAGYRTLST